MHSHVFFMKSNTSKCITENKKSIKNQQLPDELTSQAPHSNRMRMKSFGRFMNLLYDDLLLIGI